MNTLIHLLLELVGMRGGFAIIVAADMLAVLTVPSVLSHRRGRPLAALAWIFGVFAVPGLGVIAWWSAARPRRRRPERDASVARDAPRPPPPDAGPLAGVLPPRSNPGHAAPSSNNRLELLVDGTAAFAALEGAIESACTRIDAMFYIWKDDEVGRRLLDRLTARARAGIRVRLLVDAGGSPLATSRLFRTLRAAGGLVSSYSPFRFRPWKPTFNWRNHRKLLVADDIAFVGGMNVGREYEESWHDLLLRIDGPGVADLTTVFEADWAFANHEASPRDTDGPRAIGSGAWNLAVLTSGPDADTNAIHDAAFLAITSARKRVFLTTPYFVPPPALVAALRGAAQRGVDVRVMMAGQSDVPLIRLASRPFHDELRLTGVRLFEYQPRVLHAKYLVVDEALSFFGSSNLDRRSLTQDLEIVCVSTDVQINAKLAECFVGNMAHSTDVTRAASSPRSRLAEAAAHLLSPLL